MANEITVSQGLSCLNGNFNLPNIGGSFTHDQTTAGGGLPGFQAIGTSHESISTSDLTAVGWAIFKNLDDTNYVEIGLDVAATFYPLARMNAGEMAGPFRIATGVTLYARANTAACNIQAIVLDA